VRRKQDAAHRALHGDEQQEPLDINRAGVQDLLQVPWVTPTLAEAIVEERAEGGAFRSVRDLDRVPGLTDDLVAALLPYLQAPRRVHPVTRAVALRSLLCPETDRPLSVARMSLRTGAGRATCAIAVPQAGKRLPARVAIAAPGGSVTVWWNESIVHGAQTASTLLSARTLALTSLGRAHLTQALLAERHTVYGDAQLWCGRAAAAGARSAATLVWGGAWTQVAHEWRCSVGAVSRGSHRQELLASAARHIRMPSADLVVGLGAMPYGEWSTTLRSGVPESGWDIECRADGPVHSRRFDPSPRSARLRITALYQRPQSASVRIALSRTERLRALPTLSTARYRLAVSYASAAETDGRSRVRVNAATAAVDDPESQNPLVSSGDPFDRTGWISSAVRFGDEAIPLCLAGSLSSVANEWCVGWSTDGSFADHVSLCADVRHATPSRVVRVPAELDAVHLLRPRGSGMDVGWRVSGHTHGLGGELATLLTVETQGRVRARLLLAVSAP
jgi:hypothetical protein